MSEKRSAKGFSAVEAIAVILVFAVIGLAGWYVWRHDQPKKSSTVSSATASQAKPQQTADPYAGWKTATSPRAGFSIKYPADWTYGEQLGAKDNVEHITIDSANFHITIDSYLGKDASDGGQPTTTCPDCSQTTGSTSFTATKLGVVDLKTITYTLDAGVGNALILEQPDSTYYISSADSPSVSTSFRGISNLGSEQAYQKETQAQLEANPDFKTAQKVFQSLAY